MSIQRSLTNCAIYSLQLSHKCQGLHRSIRRCRKWFLIGGRSRKLSSDVVIPNLAYFRAPVYLRQAPIARSDATTTHKNKLLISSSWPTFLDHRLHEWWLRADEFWISIRGNAFECRRRWPVTRRRRGRLSCPGAGLTSSIAHMPHDTLHD